MPVFALVDCNNFYVSCERAFNPALAGKPVIVLSNNDGCAVARSNEAKALGIKMGAPVFTLTGIIEKHGIHVFSSNYALYGDMSRRMVMVLAKMAPALEVYSIDEAFLDLSGFGHYNLTEYGRLIKKTAGKHTGLPVSVGIAGTKTLAKIAASIAKKSEKTRGVLDLTHSPHIDKALEITKIEDVWGVGRRYAKFLKVYGISNARELRDAPRDFIRKKMGINGTRLIDELKGISCYPLEHNPPVKKGVTVSRTFGTGLESFDELREAVCNYASRGAAKLRKAELTAGVLSVFIMTSRFKQETFYYNTETVRFPVSTSDTTEIVAGACRALENIYADGLRYKKAGILFRELDSANQSQMTLFDDPADRERSKQLMASLDSINSIMGKGALKYASEGIGSTGQWRTRFDHRSPSYTTCWDQLPCVS